MEGGNNVGKSSVNRTSCQPVQGCKIPFAGSHLRVKCYAGRVKVLTLCVVLFQFTASQRKIGT